MQKESIARYAVTVLVVFLFTVIQTTLLHAVEIFGIIPNLLLSTVICYSLVKGEPKAIIFGLICGMLLDFFGGRTVGMNTLLCLYTSLICVLLHSGLFNNNTFVAMLFVFVLTIPYELIVYFFNLFIWRQQGFLFALFLRVLPQAVYNALVTIFIYPLTRWLANEWQIQRTRKRYSRYR